MSFGFGVGDFIAVGELCWKLYRQVYDIARDAPEAIQNLKAELGDMQLTIKKLIGDANDPDSILVQSGPDRLSLACSVLEKTMKTLQELENLSGKYELLQKPSSHLAKRHFWKRNYDKVKFAAESRTINDLRAKLVFYNGQISLLLQMVQNSSLERIEKMQKKTENALQDIKVTLNGTTSKGQTPLLSGFTGADQHRMTRKLLEQAEVNRRPLTSIGILDWLQTGKWWLLKAQSQIYSTMPSTPEYSQAWLNLIKATWILTDVIAEHPQRGSYGSGLQEMDILDIVQAVKAQHEDLAKKSLPRPALDSLDGLSWTIWISTSSTALLPSLRDGVQNSRQWGTDGGFVLFQRFAILHTSTIMHECIVFLEVKSEEKNFTLITQSFEGHDLWRCSVRDYNAYSGNTRGGRVSSRNTLGDKISSRNTRDVMIDIRYGKTMELDERNTLEFSNRDDFFTTFLLTSGAKLYMESASSLQCDESLIYAMTLLDILSSSSRSLKEEVKIIKPRLEELIHGDSNMQIDCSELLWDVMKFPLSEKPADFDSVSFKLWWKQSQRHARFIVHYSESMEQCAKIFKNFPGLVEDHIRNVVEAAARIRDNAHVCITTNSLGGHDGAIAIDTRSLCKLLEYTRENMALTYELFDAIFHWQVSNDVSRRNLVRNSLKLQNWHGIWYLLAKDGNIGMNGTPLSEIWDLELALCFMNEMNAPLELLRERPGMLNVFREAPYLTTFVVIANGLGNAVLRLSSRGLLDPNLPALVNGDGVDVLSGLDRLGIPHWPLRLATNMCSDPKIIRSLCEAGAHIGGDDEVLYNDLEVYKALLWRSDSQAQEIFGGALALVRAALNHPNSPTQESMVPQVFISRDGQHTSLQGYWEIRSHVYWTHFEELHGAGFETRWKQPVLAIIQETQEQRNLHAWLRRNATITSAFE